MNGSLNKSKSKNYSNEDTPKDLKENQFKNKNANGIQKSSQRKATPEWGEEKLNLKTSQNNSLGMLIEKMSKKKKNVEDSAAKKNNWLLDFNITDNKNI